MEVDLHVTNKCNLKCKHCVYSSGEKVMEDMTLNDVMGFVEDFKKMRVKEIHITGGEPLLNKEIFNIVSFLHSKGFLIRIQTNGFLLDEVAIKKMKRYGVSQILISLDGLEGFHNSFRNNKNAYNLAIRAIKFSLNSGLFTRVNTVLSKKNIDQIKPLMTKMKKMNIDQHSFFYFTPIGRGQNMKDSMIALKEWKKVQDEIVKIARDIDFLSKVSVQDVFHENDVDYSKSPICRGDNCLILSDKNVYHCVFFANSFDYKLGNAKNDKVFNIWKNCDSLIKKLVSIDKNRCKNRYCGGGCPGIAYSLEGGISKCDSRCDPSNKIISNCIRRYKNK